MPLFKGEDGLLARTCRLKPVLPTLSKILKRIMYNGIFAILLRIKFQFWNIFAWRTILQLNILKLVRDIIKFFEKRKMFQAYLIDIKKAFNTVNNQILPKKTEIIWHEW